MSEQLASLNNNKAISYSTSEKKTGATWIDGKPLYQKTIYFGALPNATSKDVAHNITNIDTVVNYFGCANDSSGTGIIMPFVNTSNVINQIQLAITSTSVRVTTGIDRSSFNKAYVTIQYTKTTD